MGKQTSLTADIEAAAKRLGASQDAIFKWRQRGIPAAWRFKLVCDEATSFTAKDMERYKTLWVRGRRTYTRSAAQ